MRRLQGAHEHLDGPLDPLALDGNLRDLARLNARLGGVAITRRALQELVAGVPSDAALHLLDVGTGAADIPVALLADGAPGTRLRVTAIDARPEIVDWARLFHRDRTDLDLVVGDGTDLPWPDGAFDVAHVSLVLHHLEPEAAGRLLGELARVARLGVIVNDLDRSRRAWVGAWVLLHALTRNRYTRHDGPLSVRRAYRPGEVAGMAARHGLVEVARHHAPFRHRYAIAFRCSSEPGT
jgi:ubiquinone/menaquinone biosynthesis C-methylase UbiE